MCAHDRLAARIATLEPEHPLQARRSSPAIHWILHRQKVQTRTHIPPPPWAPNERDAARAAIHATGRAAGPAAFQRWAANIHPLDFIVYTDGALQNGRAGVGYYITRGPTCEIDRGSIGLGDLATVYDAEIRGAVSGLREALQSYMAQFTTDVTICLDNERSSYSTLYRTNYQDKSSPDY
jgi:hypothetical protein